MAKQTQMEKVLDYRANYGDIPKDYMERLAWLRTEYNYTREDFEYILSKIDELKEMKWQTVTYVFYMDPKSSPRPRLNPNTFTFYVEGAKFNKEIFDRFKEEHSQMEVVISTPCIFETKTYSKIPASMNIREIMAAELELIHNVNAPDWDNLGKSYSDMVQDTLVSNDSIVCRGAVEKFFSVLPRIEVTVHFMMAYDCKYNKKTVEKRKSFYENPNVLRDLDYII